MPPIDWTAIVLAVLAAIKECREEDDAKLVKSVRNPGPLQRLRFERHVRKQLAIGPLEWVKVGRSVMAEIAAEQELLTDGEIFEMITQAKAA